MISIWDLKGWYEFAIRGIFAMGILSMVIFLGMQIFGWEVEIGLPTIQHTFVKK